MKIPEMTRLYADESVPLPVVERLRHLGHDVLTCEDAGKTGKVLPDAGILAFATAEERCLLTLNRRDFIRLHLEVPVHEGIVVCQVDADFSGQAASVDKCLEGAGDVSGRLLRVSRSDALQGLPATMVR